jgi:hypothetical protein
MMISRITEHLECIKAVYASAHESHASSMQEINNKLLQATKHILKVTKEENSQLKATMLFKDLAITALKEEVATIKGKYDTLASDHANVIRDYELRINQKDEELNNANAQITQFQVLFSTLTEEKDQLSMKLNDEYQCKECVVCQESRKEYAFLPCGHMCVCEGCAASIQERDRNCPLCRGVSMSIMKIFH